MSNRAWARGRSAPLRLSAARTGPQRRRKTRSGCRAARSAARRSPARWRPEPDILLLDEPTNHLDLPAIEWLEAELKSLRSAFVLISHDRRFLQSLSNRTVWLDRGESRRLDRGFAHSKAGATRCWPRKRPSKQLLAKRIEAGEHWMRYGVTARRKRNMRRVELLSTLRKERKEHEGAMGAVRMASSTGDMSRASSWLKPRHVQVLR
jgi:ABC transport system ATP-binding/permease protein